MSDLFIITHALGAAQGIFLATVLASKRRGSLPNRILAVVMLAFAIDLGMAVYHAAGVERTFPHLIGIDHPLAFLYGPLLYLYVRTLSRGEHVFRPSNAWHFVPFALVVLAMLPFYLQSGAEKVAFLHGSVESAWSGFLRGINHVKLLVALGYIAAIVPLLRRHRRRVRDTRSSEERINLIWLRNLIYGVIALTGVAVVLYVLSLGDQTPAIGLDPASSYDDYMLLSLAVFVYAIGYFGLRQPEVFDARAHGPAGWVAAAGETTTPAVVAEGADGSDRPRYARSGMDDATAAQYEQTLRLLMEDEKVYRRGDLTLQDLAGLTGISPHHITEVLNTRLGQNFYDFVNGYRVQEVKARLMDPSSTHMTLLAIGMDAGFNSKSSFNLVFKKHTKMTPSEYRVQAARAVTD